MNIDGYEDSDSGYKGGVMYSPVTVRTTRVLFNNKSEWPCGTHLPVKNTTSCIPGPAYTGNPVFGYLRQAVDVGSPVVIYDYPVDRFTPDGSEGVIAQFPDVVSAMKAGWVVD